ncbi:MAG: NUDIX hydrolase [Methylophilaceae bacterium]|jgi:ADP-ribose pyrophosphatase
MIKPDLTEYFVSTKILAQGKLLTVNCDQVRLANGHLTEREYVIHPGAVIIVPILANGNVILERQFRYPLRLVFIELPAGKIDANEDVLHTGQRELLEETGYSANEWVRLGQTHPCIGYSNEVIHIYLARSLMAGKHQRDADESLEVFELPFAQCLNMIVQGEITDGKTIAALFLADQFLKSESAHG